MRHLNVFFKLRNLPLQNKENIEHSIIWETFICKRKSQKAVEAYKNARNNSKDEETRYNYALAKELLENEKLPEEQNRRSKGSKRSRKG